MSPRSLNHRRRGLYASAFCVVSILLGIASASAQRPVLDVLTSGESPESAAPPNDAVAEEDPLIEIETALARARERHSALEDALRADRVGDEPLPSAGLEWSNRLIRVIEQRREAQIQQDELMAGRAAIETALDRDPSEFFGDPPPFPVPILDGVMESWRNAVGRQEQHSIILEDRRANAELAEDAVIRLEKERRRLREQREKADETLEQIRLDGAIRSIEDQLPVAREELALSKQRVAIAEIEHEIKTIATRQALAARSWIEAHLAPDESDLADAIEQIDLERFELDRKIDFARARVIDAESALRAAEERRTGSAQADESSEAAAEIATRRRQLSHRQHLVAMLNQQIGRLGRMRTTWKHRYAVLGEGFDVERAPEWLRTAERELERLTRDRRIEEAELASLQLDLANLLRNLTDADPATAAVAKWHRLELEDLENLVAFYQTDLEFLEESIGLEERLRAELLSRLTDRSFGERFQAAMSSLQGFWSYEITTSEDSPITPGKIVIAVAVIAGGYLLARLLMGWLGRRLFPRLGFDSGASNAFASLSFYGILAMVFLLALRAVNIPLTAFAVVGGALALGIGFGSQAIVSNFISGLLLLAERPIRMGDLIEIGGVVGSVEAIGLRSTRIRTPDNFHIIVPNSSFLESNVINWTHEDPMIRIRVAVGVAYGSPTRKVADLLVEAATEHPRTLPTPPPAVFFEDFADSALAFELRFWIRYDERTDRSAIRSELRFRINELFEENGIVIAFPQLDVHLEPRATQGADRGLEATDSL